MSQSTNLSSLNKYEIKIYGELDDSSLSWFGETDLLVRSLDEDSQVTTLSNVVMDQAGLVGLIRRLHGRGIVLISLQQV